MAVIEFDRKVGKQIKVNKRAEFIFPNKHGEIIQSSNNFPQLYEVIIGNEKYSGGLYFNPRPYYYFEIHKSGHNSFFNFVGNKNAFHVVADLESKIVLIK
jgi:hypothetical protein